MQNIDKVAKALGRDTVEEMDAMDEAELKKVIVDASTAMKQVKEELEANKDYQAAKADVQALSQGKREVDKRQKARIAYAIDRIDGLGKLDVFGIEAFHKNRREFLARAAKKAKESLGDDVDVEVEQGDEE